MKKKTIKKLLISFFLICIFIIISIFSSAYYIIHNYKPLLAKIGITVEDNCNFGLSKISCDYINIKAKNFESNLKEIEVNLYLKSIFNDKKFLRLTINKIDTKIFEKKENKDKKLPNLSKIFKYSYKFLKKSDIFISSINFTYDQLKIKNLSFKNFQNKFSILKPFYIIYQNDKAVISQLKGFVDNTQNKLILEEVSGNLYNSKIFLKGYYSSDNTGNFSGFAKGDFTKISEFSLKNFDLNFNLEIQDYVLNYNVDGKVELLENPKLGNIDKISITLNGKLNEEIKNDINFKFYSAYLMNDYFIKEFSLKGKLLSNKSFKDLKGNFDLKIAKVENSKFSFKDISTNFDIYKDKILSIQGNTVIDSKFNFDFIAKIEEKENFSLNIKNLQGNIEDVLLSMRDKPKWLDKLGGKFVANLKYRQNGNINLEAKVENFKLFGVDFKKSNISLLINSKNFDFYTKGKLVNENSFLDFKITSKDKNLNGKINYNNVDISNLIWIKLANIKTVVSGKGIVYGSIKNPKFELSGNSKFFEYKKLHIPNVDYQFLYESKRISITANHKNKIESLVDIYFSPFNLKISIKGKSIKGEHIQPFLADINPKVFKFIKPKDITGDVNIQVSRRNFDIELDFENSRVLLTPVDNIFIASLKGKIKKNHIYLSGNFGKENFKFKEINIKDIQGQFILRNKKFSLSAFARGSKNLDEFLANYFMNLDIANNILESKFSINGEKFGYRLAISGSFSGETENLKGNINYVLQKSENLISKDTVNLHIENKEYTYAKIFKNKLKFKFQPKISLYLDNPQVELILKDNDKYLYLFFPNVKIYKSKVELLSLVGFLAKVDDEKLSAYPFFHSGVFKGQIDLLRYWFSSKNLELKAKGKLNKQVISEVVQILSVDGDAQYSLNYNGNIKDFISRASLRIYSKNLKLKSTYVIGIVDIKDLMAYMSNGTLNLKLTAEDNLALLSKGIVDLYATSYLNKKEIYAYAEISNLPIKYQTLFKGNVTSELNIKLKNLEGEIKGRALLAGNLKLNLEDINNRESQNKESNLENIKLDIKVSSYLPIYIYGDWGEAYAEIKGHLTGTLASPIFNGEITIIYGKISYMKNNFNIDFANIKISNNIPFVTARLSTVVANTHIFINISGSPPDDLTFNFSSTPPRSREEIMAILLLRNTPNALENIPVFTAFGKLVRRILPLDKFLFSGDSSNTFLNTGFEISVAPRYSPTEGIVATIYAKRDITRRLFVALSKPISQTTSQTLVGWYEGGIRLTETTSLFTRFYEDGRNEVGIIFNLPFDF